ncbi:glycine betaine ABC transporter substrate-binding protein [Sansalvadorimonas sp. 2012CJ34-2]|uniref:Glycine betaine ABC transporter substrate-binding protein n=2 Tax=Parendozoicomonas callyspongiae TaxID=2942213 RepID=A0ABT0PHD8_9GAMM|nr:glycine betaine ABC transporter substrate-binding protein [Sansalvadorimonas sp. 2012CJ34-2]MCL6270795.1 glycine betaine ABC transporter substrate-binding protein [Sansalvadorimonas sp. 2012CJ34-2]
MKTKLLGLMAALITSFTLSVQAVELVVGGKGYTEQLLLASMTEQFLKANGYDVDKRDGMGSTVLRKAQLNDQVDLYWEYTGTSLRTYNKIKDKMTAREAYNKVKELDGKLGIIWLNPSKANNTYALAVRADDPKMANINTLSDLAEAVNDGEDFKFAANIEFPVRPDGLKPLQKTYDFKFKRSNVKKMDPGLAYQALKLKEVDIALVFGTDGRIGAFGFKVLGDDKGFFPDYSIVPVIRQGTLQKHPKVGELLNTMSSKLDDKTMSGLNAKVDVDRQSIEKVAKDFLKKEGLIK